jgi:hypothetical protein
MATAYRAPDGFEPPEITTDQLIDGSYQEIEQEYVDRLAAEARKNGNSKLLGEEIRFQRGDGYARYMVWNTNPLQLIHLDLGDAWSVEEALIRGLRVKDVKEKIEGQKRLASLFGKN